MNNYTLTFNGKHYRFNLDKINQYCLVSGNKAGNESEITEAYETDENGEFHLTSKINREITTPGNSQDDMIMYDFIKTMVVRLVESQMPVYANETQTDFGLAIAFNTMIFYGMIEEVTNEEQNKTE